jgi:pimeloyl-ACP methyl ester carboxylesterase
VIDAAAVNLANVGSGRELLGGTRDIVRAMDELADYIGFSAPRRMHADTAADIPTPEQDPQFIAIRERARKTMERVRARRTARMYGTPLYVSPLFRIPQDFRSRREALLLAYDSRESVAYVRDHILTALPLTDAQKERVIEDSLRGAAAAKQAWPTRAMLEDIRSDARLINVPTLVLSGERDQVDPTARLREEVLPCISKSKLQVLPQTGHLAMLEDPEAVARAIRQFVSKP